MAKNNNTARNNSIFETYVKCDCNKDLANKLDNVADRKGVSRAEIMRRYLTEYVNADLANSSMDAINRELRVVIKNEIKPFENRVAKLIAKAAIGAATSMFMNVQLIDDIGKTDTVDLYQKARKKAVAFVKESDETYED